MFGLLTLTFVSVVSSALARSACRSSCMGVSLSNGLEVMVDEPTHQAIEREFQSLTDSDPFLRWDQAVLNILKPVRPAEWAFLSRALNPSTALNKPHGALGRTRAAVGA